MKSIIVIFGTRLRWVGCVVASGSSLISTGDVNWWTEDGPHRSIHFIKAHELLDHSATA
jgi:hypothetical protein